jgi:hypothetical protein
MVAAACVYGWGGWVGGAHHALPVSRQSSVVHVLLSPA